MPSSRRSALAAILWGGFVAGTVDVGAASLISGYSPIVILKYIAGGVLGRASLAGGMGNARLGYVRGLRALGAMADAAGLPADYPHAQFSKFTLDLGYQRRLSLADQPLQWTSLISAQYSRDPLIGSQQFLIGSPRTVRGSRSGTRMSSTAGRKTPVLAMTRPSGAIIALTPLVATTTAARPLSMARSREMASCWAVSPPRPLSPWCS